METKRITNIHEAAQLLQTKEVVAFPTETVYGLGADATSDEAVAKIFQAKGRPSDNPLIVHIGDLKQLPTIVTHIPENAKKLMNAFWPGPLTIILKKQEGLSHLVTAGLNTVGVRMPDHPVALELIKTTNLPIAAPSANASGKPSPTKATHVAKDLNGKISAIVEGDALGVGVESTVIDCTTQIPVILRPGGITKAQIEAVIGEVQVDNALIDIKAAPKSPGMKYTHYAPNAPMTLIKGSSTFFQDKINEARQLGKKVGVLTSEENANSYQADIILTCGKKDDMLSVAQKLYDVLRAFNELEVDLIYSEYFDESGLGHAVMNRLLKASGHRMIEE